MILTDNSAIQAFCARMSEADFITVDTEFLRENSFWPKLCLIQVANDKEAAAIDPLADGVDLAPFFALMDNPKILKVLHAARQDLEIFHHLSGRLPYPVFDTQVAAMVCGFGDSVGYETLVGSITRRPLDKSHRYTDWSRRPLSEAQITYAIGDVTHLRDIYRHLQAELDKTGRSDWLLEEMDHLLNPDAYITKPTEAWQRLKVRTNKREFLGILRAIAAWRERAAQEKDLPRGRIAKDETLLEIAAHPPQNAGSLEKTRGIAKGFSRSQAGHELLAAIEEARLHPEDWPTLEKIKPRPATPPMAELLKVLLRVKSQESGVAPRMIASSSELEAWAAEPHKAQNFLQGWRAQIFGDDALRLLKGELALTSNKGNIEIVEIEAEATA